MRWNELFFFIGHVMRFLSFFLVFPKKWIILFQGNTWFKKSKSALFKTHTLHVSQNHMRQLWWKWLKTFSRWILVTVQHRYVESMKLDENWCAKWLSAHNMLCSKCIFQRQSQQVHLVPSGRRVTVNLTSERSTAAAFNGNRCRVYVDSQTRKLSAAFIRLVMLHKMTQMQKRRKEGGKENLPVAKRDTHPLKTKDTINTTDVGNNRLMLNGLHLLLQHLPATSLTHSHTHW